MQVAENNVSNLVTGYAFSATEKQESAGRWFYSK